MNNNQISYYAIIPADVRYDKDITANAKLLYGEITALCNKEGYCWASNTYFANLYGVSNVSVSKWINSLEKAGYLHIENDIENGNKRIIYLKDLLKKSLRPIKEKFKTPIKEKFIHNNTSNNNTSNNTSNNTKNNSSLHSELVEAQNIANYLLEKILQFKPNFKTPNINQWAKDIDLAIRIDKRTHQELINAINWIYSPAGSFWRANILSGKKLREKYDTIEAQAMNSKSTQKDNVVSAYVAMRKKGMTMKDLERIQ